MFYSIDDVVDMFLDINVPTRYQDIFCFGIIGLIPFYINIPLGMRAYAENKRLELEIIIDKEYKAKKINGQQYSELYEGLRSEQLKGSFDVDLCGYYIIPPKVIQSLDNNEDFILWDVINPENKKYLELFHLKNSLKINKSSIRICFKDIAPILEDHKTQKPPKTKQEILQNNILEAINKLKLKPMELTNKTVPQIRKYCLQTWPTLFTPPNKESGYKGNFEDAYQSMKEQGLLKNISPTGVRKKT